MTYHRATRPVGDNAGTSIDLIPPARRRQARVRRRGGLGDFFDEIFGPIMGAVSPNPGMTVTPIDPNANPEIDLETGTTLVFNTTKFPGICKPMNKATLDVTVVFQRQLNRVAQVKGFPKIAADGDIGTLTLALFRKVQGVSGGTVMGDGSSCAGIGPDLGTITRQIEALGDKLGAPTTVGAPSPARTPSFLNAQGVEVKVPGAGGAGSLVDVVKNMPLSMKLAFAGITVGIGYFAFFDKKRRR
jgi:hypothetical protein